MEQQVLFWAVKVRLGVKVRVRVIVSVRVNLTDPDSRP